MTSLLSSLPITTARHLLRRHNHHHRFFFSTTTSKTTANTTANCHRNVIDVLHSRGLIESTTSPSLHSAAATTTTAATPLKVYCGFDPTAASLHLGNLLAIIVLSWFHRYGHSPIALIGGATARVGDPSGKSTERPQLDDRTLSHNIAAISLSLKQISRGSFVILDNFDWWKDFSFLDFLKYVGRFARVGVMLSKDSVKSRLESDTGISFTEFSYQLLQGYDFVHLCREFGVRVQIGGSDQWGNITAGTDLIRKILKLNDEGGDGDGDGGNEEVYGLTFPLLLKSDGSKFGKSEDGAVWLSSKLLSPYKFYQYLFSVPDDDVIRFLKMLTFLELDEIDEIEKGMKGDGYVPNSAQRRLAEEVTRFVHGEDGLEEAVKATEALRPGAETKLDSGVIEGIAKDVPSCSLGYDEVVNVSIVDVSVLTGLLESKAAVRRMVKQGGLYLNNSRVDSDARMIEAGDIVDGKVFLLSAGKKNKMVVRVS